MTTTCVLRSKADSGPHGQLLAWALVACASFAAVSAGIADCRLLGWLAVLLGIWSFWSSGRYQVDAIGIWALAGILFVGVAAIIIPDEVASGLDWLAVAIFSSLAIQILTIAIAWPRPTRAVRPSRGGRDPLTLSSRTLIAVGVLGFGLSLVLAGYEPTSNLAAGFLWASPLLAMLGAASSKGSKALSLMAPAVLTAAYLITWYGGGRLTVLALLVGLVMTYQYRCHPESRVVKVAVLLGSVGGLVIAALVETNRGNPEVGLLAVPGDFKVTDSLYSVWSPLYVFARILSGFAMDVVQPHGLHTLYATLVVWIPRGLWESKPEGWGRDLAWVVNPAAAEASSHSEAALAPAEFLWGFGYWGLVIAVPVLGIVLRVIGRGLHRCMSLDLVPGRGAPVSVAWIILATSLLSLWWTGTFTFWSRASMQLLAVAVLVGLGHLAERALGSPVPGRGRRLLHGGIPRAQGGPSAGRRGPSM